MYAEKFDDFRRHMLSKPVDSWPFEVQRLQTCMIHTPTWEEWVSKFLKEENTDIHVTVEPDNVTYTFYTIIPRGETSNV